MSKEASRKRDLLGGGMDQRKVHPRLGHRCPRVLELPRGVVEPDRPGAAPRELDRPARGAAAELEDVLAFDLAERAELGLGDRPCAPDQVVDVQLRAMARLVLVRLGVPVLAVAERLLRERASGNQSAISRAADSGESEPCTRLSGIESARSPRIEPGVASAGLVAPIVVRTVAIAPSPSSTSASVGAEVMNSTSSPKNGFSSCSA